MSSWRCAAAHGGLLLLFLAWWRRRRDEHAWREGPQATRCVVHRCAFFRPEAEAARDLAVLAVLRPKR